MRSSTRKSSAMRCIVPSVPSTRFDPCLTSASSSSQIVGEVLRVGSEVKHLKVGDIAGVGAVSLATSSLSPASRKVSPILLLRLASNPTPAATATSARTTRSPTAPRASALTTVGTRRELERGTSRMEDTPTTGEDLVTSPSSEFCPSFPSSHLGRGLTHYCLQDP